MRLDPKWVGDLAASIAVTPAYGLYRLSAAVMGASRAFPGWSQAFGLIPGHGGVYLRRAFYRLLLPRCGTGASIGFGSIFSHASAELGQGVYIGPFCVLGDIVVEDDVLIASHVSVPNGCRQHGLDRFDIPVREQPGIWPRITIGRDTWVGDRAVVMADVGRHCVIGAGAVVTRAIPDYAIAVGVPAKIVGYRNNREQSIVNATHLESGEII